MPARISEVARRRYEVRWRDGTRSPTTGRLIERASQTFRRLDEAQAFKRQVDKDQRVRRELRRGSAGRTLSMDAIIAAWSKSRQASGAVRSGYSAEKRRVLTALCEAQGWSSVVAITADAIDTWRSSVVYRGVATGRGTDKPLQMIKTLLRYAAGTLRQPVDPAALLVESRKRPRKPQPALLERHTADWLIACSEARGGEAARAIIEHLLCYGCRPIDACRCTVGDFDSIAGTLTLRDTKSGTTVTHPLLPGHVERYRNLAEGRGTDDALFLNPYGEPWRIRSGKKREEERAEQLTSWYWNNVSRWLLPSGQRGIYCLKDFAITELDAAGVDDRTKALFTGHKTLAVFERYKATNAGRARDALAKLVNSRRV